MDGDDPAAVVHSYLFDELAEQFFGLFVSLGHEDAFDPVGKTFELCLVRGCVPVCGGLAGEVGFVGVECFEAFGRPRTRSWQTAAESWPFSNASK
jgi:hypothetical protein